jgi:hypothetical protein
VHNILLSCALQELLFVNAETCGFIDDIEEVVLGLLLPFTGHTSGVDVLEVLQPFEIADCNSTSITEHIWQESNSFGEANLLSLDGCGPISSLDNNFALKSVSVVDVDGHFKCSWDKDIAEYQHFYQGL